MGTEARKPWVTDEMIRKPDERRKLKNVSTDDGLIKYKQVFSELRRETDKAREDWWMDNVRLLMRYIERVGQMYFIDRYVNLRDKT